MQLALVLAILFLSGCAGESGLTKQEQSRQAIRKQAYEAGRQYREQYIAAKQPVFRLKFRHQYPTMSEEEIEVLVNDALEEGLREERQRLFGGPTMRSPAISPPVSCTSSRIGSYTYTDCY
jgi:hypothetical protein